MTGLGKPMRQQVNIVCEDDSEIQINFNCDEDLKSRHRLTFRLHPPSLSGLFSKQTKQTDESPNTQAPVSGEPVEFVIKVWKYKGYLIVQHSEKDFSIYNSDGSRFANYTTLEGACKGIGEIIDQSKPKNRMKP
jgi:hypothetical protein